MAQGQEKRYKWHENPSEMTEQMAWGLFREARWNADRCKVCLRCQSPVSIRDKRKNRNQNYYLCRKCGARFTDLTDCLFDKTKLTMKTILFIIVLKMGKVPANKIYQLLQIARTSVERYTPLIPDSSLCRILNERLKNGGIDTDAIIRHKKVYVSTNKTHPIKCRLCGSFDIYLRGKDDLVCANCVTVMNHDGSIKRVSRAGGDYFRGRAVQLLEGQGDDTPSPENKNNRMRTNTLEDEQINLISRKEKRN